MTKKMEILNHTVKGKMSSDHVERFRDLKELKYLSNQELDLQLGQQISREREILSSILLHIQEVDRRKMYLDFQYPNLFMYLTKHKGYSNASAQRRIDAARLGPKFLEWWKVLTTAK